MTVRKLKNKGYQPFLDNAMHITYSWGQQTNNPALHEEKFLDENDESIRSLKIIRLKSTPLSAL
jgi:hypothetical protein